MSLGALLERAARRPVRLLLAGGDVAMLETAAAALRTAGIAWAKVVGSGELRPEQHSRLGSVALLLRSREPNRVHDGIHALDLAGDPLRFACGLLALGDVDAVVAGPGLAYEELTAAADWTLGAPMDGGPVHSATWLLAADGNLVAFADCAETTSRPPSAQARLARAVAQVHQRVSEVPARVAFLTGPARHEPTAALDAVERLKAMDPGIMAEADPAARFRREADVLIFPSGVAGHLAARTLRALSGARILGPLLLGPPGTVAGVSEDSTVEELVGTAALAILASGTGTT